MKEDREEIRKELEDLAPGLSRFQNKEDGFRVPAGYFQSLPDEVIDKLGIGKKSRQKSGSLWLEQWLSLLLQPRPALALASLLVVLIAGWWFLNRQSGESLPSETVAFEQITPREAADYLSQNLDEVDEELLLEFVSNDPSLDAFIDMELNQLEDDQLEEMVDEFFDDLEIEDLL